MREEQFNQKYKENQDILHSKDFIDSFIEFFGEEYRTIITQKILDTPVIWYVPNIETPINPLLYTDLSEEQLQYIVKNVSDMQLKQSIYNPIYNFLVLPIDCNISHIIHEMCHMLTCHILRKEPTLALLNGIGISIEKYEGFFEEYGNDLNEIINQRITRDIESIYRTKVKFDSSPSYQDVFFPLIEMFYSTFKQEIIKSEMTGNLMNLLDRVGSEEFEEYQQLFFRLVFKLSRSKQENIEFLIDEKYFVEAASITDKMMENSKKINMQ
jgi:hypothetical protein